MKKVIAFLLALMMLCTGFVGCEEFLESVSYTDSSATDVEDTSTVADSESFEESITSEDSSLIAVPTSFWDLMDLPYTEVVTLFTDAGFTNVTAVGYEVDGIAAGMNDTVVTMSIGEDGNFDKGDRYEPDTPIEIWYRTAPAASSSEVTSSEEESSREASSKENSSKETSSREMSSKETSSKATSSRYTETPSGNGSLVWIPTKGGKKYHRQADCSNMDGPRQVTLDEAQRLGFTACKKCY